MQLWPAWNSLCWTHRGLPALDSVWSSRSKGMQHHCWPWFWVCCCCCYLSVCFMHVCMGSACTHVCICVWMPEDNLWCHPQKCCPCPLRQVLSLDWSLSIWLDWLAREPQRSLYHLFPHWDCGSPHTRHFYISSEDQTQDFLLVRATTLATELSTQSLLLSF